MGEGRDSSRHVNSGASAPVTLGITDHGGIRDALQLAWLAPFLAGTHPHAATRSLTGRRSLEELLPAGWILGRRFVTTGAQCLSCHVPSGELAAFVVVGARRIDVWLSGASAEAVDACVAHLDDLEAARPVPSGRKIALWHYDPSFGPTIEGRWVEAVRWGDVVANYPEPTRSLLAATMALERPEERGRLLLWRGAPGTGKTYAIRALTDAWSSWCDIHVVIDAERLFDSPKYLAAVLSYERDLGEDGSGSRWKLVIAEDADEYLRVGGGRRSSAALGRLLNATDGLLGSGADALVLLTTNQELGRIDPALSRPGRCLGVVEFAAFVAAEAQAWLASEAGDVAGEMTLAELFQQRSEGRQLSTPPAPLRLGSYL